MLMRSLLVSLVLLTSGLSGCLVIKARSAPDAGFLPHEDQLREMRERAPFHAVYIPDPDRLERLKKTYKNVVVEPVLIEPFIEKIRASSKSKSTKTDRIDDARELARYFEARMKVAFAKDDKLKVIDIPTKDSFVWQLAITQVEPTDPAVSALATVAGVLVPGGGALQLAASGSIAIEGIIRDGDTGDILMEFKDRESDKTAPFTVKDFQMYAHSRQAIDEWSEQFFELATTPGTTKVDDSLPVSLDPL